MTGEDPDPTVHTIARASGQALGLRSSPRKTRKSPTTARSALTWMHPETRRSRTFAAYLLSIFKDVHPVGAPLITRSSWRSDEAPRHAASASLWFERALSRALIEPGSDGSHHLSRDVLPADPPSLARAVDRSETSTERAPVESRWDRLSRSPGQREPLRET